MLKTLNVTGHSIHRFQLQQAAAKGGGPLAKKGPVSPLEKLLANAAVSTTRSVVKRVEVGNWTTVDKVLEVRRRK